MQDKEECSSETPDMLSGQLTPKQLGLPVSFQSPPGNLSSMEPSPEDPGKVSYGLYGNFGRNWNQQSAGQQVALAQNYA